MMEKTHVLCWLFILSAISTACSNQTYRGESVNVELGIGCTGDIISYRRGLKELLVESENQEDQKRLKEIIEYVECEPEVEKDAVKPLEAIN